MSTALDHGHQEEIWEEENFEELLLHTEESPDDEVAIKVDINPALNTQQRSTLGELLHEFRNKLGRYKLSSNQLKLEMPPRSVKHLTAFRCPKGSW